MRDIPKIFFSSETGAPTKHCKVCGKFLLDEAEYAIEKAFVHYPTTGTTDLIWEIALCTNCQESMMSEISIESQKKMNAYFATHSNLSHQQQLLQEENFNPEAWVDQCIVKGTKKAGCSQFQITGRCLGNQMIFEHTPFMISGAAMDELTQLLSNQTIGTMNKFRDQHFPPPEDLSPLFRDKDFVFI